MVIKFNMLLLFMFISLLTKSQNVGIGNPTPQGKLHIRTPGTFTNAQIVIDTTGAIHPNFIVLPNGNIGIGESTPEARLHISVRDTVPHPVLVQAEIVPAILNFSYRMPITITENSGNVLNDYHVLIVVNTASLISAGKLKPDCSDIRFTDNTLTYSLPYWIESGCNTASTYIWVRVPYIPASGNITIYMFYGNPAVSSASSVLTTFLRNQIFLTTGRCTNGTNCGYTDNHNEMDAIRSSIGVGTYSIDGTGYVSFVDHSSNPYGLDDYFYMRYRFLFVPSDTGTYSFRVNSDDAMEVSIFPFDGYGEGIRTGHPYGPHDVVAFWYGGHGGAGGCGTGGTTGTRTLNGGQGYWFDVMQIEWAGGQLARLCIDDGTGWKTLSYPNFPDQIFARRYTTPEPSVSIGPEEVISATPITDTVFIIQHKTGNVGICTPNPKSKLAIKGLPLWKPDTTQSVGCLCITQEGNLWIDADGTCDCTD